jgi:hypothetical protein
LSYILSPLVTGSCKQHQSSAIDGAPSAIRGKDGRIRVFYRTPDNRIEVIPQTAVNSAFGSPAGTRLERMHSRQ